MGPLQEALAYLDNKRRAIGSNLRDLVSNPRDYLEMAAQRTADDIPAQFTDPANYIPGGGLAGIIRRGGRPDLIALHQSPLGLLARGNLPRELYSPSIAINRDVVTQDFGGAGGGSIDFIAKPDVFDPARSGGSIFVRDAYTPHHDEFLGSPLESLKKSSEGDEWLIDQIHRRLNDRFSAPDQRFGEMSKFINALDVVKSLTYKADPHRAAAVLNNLPGLSPSHFLAIGHSKPFRSFRHFEMDPRGANLLGVSRQQIEDYTLYMEDAIKKHGITKDVIRMASVLPSEYGELKLTGGVALTPEHWAGAIVRPHSFVRQRTMRNALSALTDRGIPYIVDDAPGALTRVFSNAKELINHPRSSLMPDEKFFQRYD